MDDKEQAEKLHMLSHEIFDEVSEKTHKYLESTLNSIVDENKAEVPDEDDHFDIMIAPMMAAHAASLTNYFYHIGYSKGEMLEMMCDFYDQTRDSDDDDGEDEESDGEETKATAKKPTGNSTLN
jgi:hypothetical protein